MIDQWIHTIIDGTTGLHAFEGRESLSEPRDEAVAAWVIRCLANPDCDGSKEILEAIMKRREKVART